MGPTIPCKYCGIPTRMLATQQCDGCWETRASGEFDTLAKKALAFLVAHNDRCEHWLGDVEHELEEQLNKAGYKLGEPQ